MKREVKIAGGWLSGLLGLLVWMTPLLGAVALFMHAPGWWQPQWVSVELPVGGKRVIGAHQLAADQADDEHLELHRSGVDEWRLRNVSGGKRLMVSARGDDGSRPVRSLALTDGSVFTLGEERFEARLDDAALRLAHYTAEGDPTPTNWRFDGDSLYRDGTPPANCPVSWSGNMSVASWSMNWSRRSMWILNRPGANRPSWNVSGWKSIFAGIRKSSRCGMSWKSTP